MPNLLGHHPKVSIVTKFHFLSLITFSCVKNPQSIITPLDSFTLTLIVGVLCPFLPIISNQNHIMQDHAWKAVLQTLSILSFQNGLYQQKYLSSWFPTVFMKQRLSAEALDETLVYKRELCACFSILSFALY